MRKLTKEGFHRWIVFIGIGIVSWFLITIVVLIDHNNTFSLFETIFLPRHDLYIRLVTLGIFVLTGYIAANDISQRYIKERSLKKSEKRFRKLFKAIPDPAFLVDNNSAIKEVNIAATEGLGYQKEEVLDNYLWKVPFFSEETRQSIKNHIHEDSRELEEIANPIQLKQKNGMTLYGEMNLNPFRENDAVGMVGVVRDITERKKMEEKIEVLHKWAHRLNKSDTIDDILEHTIEAMDTSLGYEHMEVKLKHGDVLELEKTRGLDVPQQYKEISISEEQGITGKAAKAGESNLLNDASSHPAYISLSPDLQAELVVPIKRDNEVLGILNVESEHKYAFNEEDKRLLENLASYVAVALKELQEKKQLVSLQKLDELRNQFLAMAAHEINTPLTPIKVKLEMFQRGYHGELTETQKKELERVMESVERLQRLVNDFRQISKLRSGKINLKQKRYSLNKTINKALMPYRSIFRQENIEILKKMQPSLEAIYDEDRIIQVLRNIIENAIDYTKNKIWIKAGQNENKIWVSIKDNGSGIPKEKQKKIFQPFYRVEENRERTNRQFGGTGLGLNISKRIIEAHNGTITVDSILGEKTTFTVSIPVKN